MPKKFLPEGDKVGRRVDKVIRASRPVISTGGPRLRMPENISGLPTAVIARLTDGTEIVLASESDIRIRMLADAGVTFSAKAARLDEEAIRETLDAEGASPRDISDALAEAKAWKIAERNQAAVVIGSDQVLEHRGKAMGKPADTEAARQQLRELRGQTHTLHSAVVVYGHGKPVWRHLGEVRLTMREFSDAYLEGYLARNWVSARHSIAAYKLEEEGIRLFSRIEGDFFTALGMPLLPLLNYLSERGFIEG
jgi:septum formation protein